MARTYVESGEVHAYSLGLRNASARPPVYIASLQQAMEALHKTKYHHVWQS